MSLCWRATFKSVPVALKMEILFFMYLCLLYFFRYFLLIIPIVGQKKGELLDITPHPKEPILPIVGQKKEEELVVYWSR